MFSRLKIKKFIKQVMLVLLFGVITGLLFSLEDFSNRTLVLQQVTSAIIIWASQWFGIDFFLAKLDKRYTWHKKALRKLVYALLIITAYTSVSLAILTLFYFVILNIAFGFKDYLESLVSVLLVTLFATIVFALIEFYREWLKSTNANEAMKEKNAQTQYEVLKNQVNPHFLFNSLNVLTELIYENQEESAKFVAKLSAVYRYILDNKDKEVVPLVQEMEFIKSYLFLIKIRHQNGFTFEIPTVDLSNYQLPPLALQIPLENAVKHNVISPSKPLYIKIYLDKDDYLSIENNYQIKRSIRSGSRGVGLKNLTERYGYLTDRKLIIEESEKLFIVKLPLLTYRNLA